MSPYAFRLERGPGNHLLLPVTAFAGREDLIQYVPQGADEATEGTERQPCVEASEPTSKTEKGES